MTKLAIALILAGVLSGGVDVWAADSVQTQAGKPNPPVKLAAKPVAAQAKSQISVCDFTYQMEWKGRTMDDSGYWNWSFCVVKGEDGKWHGFGERVKEADMPMSGDNGYPKWMPGQRCIAQSHAKLCEIAHYMADRPEGPYKFVDVALPRGNKGAFDQSKIYPCVQRDGNRWVMMYSGVPGNHMKMRGCLAVADSPSGPWKNLGIVLGPSKDPANWTSKGWTTYLTQIIKFRGKWYAYFKVWLKEGDFGGRVVEVPKGAKAKTEDFVGVAVADRPEGPWTITDRPAILKDDKVFPGTYIEDHCQFVWNDKVYLAITDNSGGVSGVPGGILLFESDDGLSFPWARRKLMVDQIQHYCPGFDPKVAKIVWGPKRYVFEAPRVLLVDGVLAYFFGGGGTNVEGEPKSANYCLKIPKWTP